MSRTKGSGWGGGVMLYQICPLCGKKKAMYTYSHLGHPFKCTWCKEYFESDKLERVTFKEYFDRLNK